MPYDLLIVALEDTFKKHSIKVPQRQTFELGKNREFLLMPAWKFNSSFGVKIVSIFPENHRCGFESINGVYILFDGKNGRALAVYDGAELTARRTASCSALASKKLARHGADTLLMIGTGKLSHYMIQAHGKCHPLRKVMVWGRNYDKARHLIQQYKKHSDCCYEAVTDLKEAVQNADIISVATRARKPLVKGSWLKSGTHIDLVGGYRPDMREADDEALRKAHIYVDTYEGTLAEAGDIISPIEAGIICENDLCDLSDLLCGHKPGRLCVEDITVFKSVGSAIEDLCAATLAYQMRGSNGKS